MGNNGYLKFILTALVLAIVFFGYMLVTAVDRVRESNLRLLAKLDELPGRISVTAPAAVPAQAAAIRREPFANAEFFDPSAQTGGRMIQATIADTANMNYLINTEATAGEFWNLCNWPESTSRSRTSTSRRWLSPGAFPTTTRSTGSSCAKGSTGTISRTR